MSAGRSAALVSRSRSRPTWVCRLRIHSPVPTNSCQRASTSPRSRLPLRTPSSTPARAVSYAAVAASCRARAAPSWASIATATPAARCSRLSSAPVSVCRTTAARASWSAASACSHARSGATWSSGSRPSTSGRSSTTNSRADGQAGALQHPGEVGRHLLHGLGRDAVQDDGQRGPPLLRRAQHVPRDGVGVPGCRRDEDPEVRRGQQLPGELPVGLHDGVDVGGVEQGQAGGQVVADDELHGPRPAGGAGDAGQAREHAVAGERGQVGGGADQDRRPRGGPQHARRGHRCAHQAVHERGLAGAGRAADDGEQRRVEVEQAREEVVVDLVGHARARRGGRRRPRAWPGPAERPPACSAAPSGLRAAGAAGRSHSVFCPARAVPTREDPAEERRRPSWPAPRAAPGRRGGASGPGPSPGCSRTGSTSPTARRAPAVRTTSALVLMAPSSSDRCSWSPTRRPPAAPRTRRTRRAGRPR